MTLEPILHEITRLQDPALAPVLDIYQQSFPLREQMRFSWWIALIQEKERGEGNTRHLVALRQAGEVVAFAYYEEEAKGTYLWYLATRADQRGGGVGARLYQEIARRAFERGEYLLFEVELPEEAARFSLEDEAFARRRVAWYRRNGARLLGGVEYVQSVGWQPPYPMGLMVAAPGDLSPEDAFTIASSQLGESLKQVGLLTLT